MAQLEQVALAVKVREEEKQEEGEKEKKKFRDNIIDRERTRDGMEEMIKG